MITLEQISKDEHGGHSGWNNDSRRDAAALFNTCSDFGFIVTLVVVQNVLSYTHAATVKLQRSQGDILKAYNDIDLIIGTLQNTVRKNIDQYHDTWFEQATKLAGKVSVSPSKPRTCSRQTLWTNTPAHTPNVYYRVVLTAPFIDHLITELNTRFDKNSAGFSKGFILIPTIMQEKIKQSGTGSWKADFKEFVSLYESDLPNPRLVDAETDIWEMKWRKHIGVLPDRISTTLKVCKPMELSFPNLYCCLKILGTLPITTCECERSISSLRRLKTY